MFSLFRKCSDFQKLFGFEKIILFFKKCPKFQQFSDVPGNLVLKYSRCIFVTYSHQVNRLSLPAHNRPVWSSIPLGRTHFFGFYIAQVQVVVATSLAHGPAQSRVLRVCRCPICRKMPHIGAPGVLVLFQHEGHGTRSNGHNARVVD